jgi:PAS domain S-box-containing protein
VTLFEEAGDALVLFDPDTEQILDVNPMTQKLSGFTRRELLLMRASYLFRSEEHGGLARLRHAFRKTETFHSQEGFLLRNTKDGVWIPLNLTLARLHVKPKTLGLITARDIHEQRDAHAKLKKTEERLRTVIANTPVILFALDRSGVFTLIEGKGLNNLVIEPADLVGQSIFEVYQGTPAILRNVCRVLGGEPFTEVVLVENGPGAGRYFETHYAPLRDSRGHISGAIGIATDITEREQAEQALRNSEAFYHSLVENLPQNILRKDARGRFTFANQLACSDLHKPLQEIIGKTDFDFFPAHLAEKYSYDDQQVMTTGETLEMVEEHITPGGERLHVQIIKTPLFDAQQETVGVQVIYWDVTQHKHDERRLIFQHAVTQVLAESDTLEQATAHLVEALGHVLGSEVGAIWDVDRRMGVLRCAHVWCAPQAQVAEFESATRSTTFAAGQGLPGRILATGKPHWINDILLDGNYPRVHAAVKHGLHAAVGLPILLGSEVLGVIEFCTRALGPADEDLLQLFMALGSQIGQFFQRKRAEDKLRRSNERFRLLVEGVKDYAIILLDPQGNVASWNEGAARIKGYAADEIIGQHVSCFYPSETTASRRPESQITRAASEGRHEDESWWVRKDGSQFWANVVTTTLHDDAGHLKGFSVIVRDLTEHKRAEEAKKSLRALEIEAAIAREIQGKLFPTAAPSIAGFDIGGISYPAVATGGDYFDYLPMLDGSLGIVIGDAAGHGSGPALLMATTRAYLRSLVLTHKDVGQILTLANSVLADDVGDRFITLILARLEPPTRSFIYVSAGHHPAGYVLSATGEVKMQLTSTGYPLGVIPSATFVPAPALTLQPGDVVLLLTDGIVEARNEGGTAFGIDRALDVVRTHRQKRAQEIVATLYSAVCDYCGGKSPLDDITAILMKVN